MERLEVLEGTWEELAAHAEEFKGRKLRLIVLPAETTSVQHPADKTALREAAARLLSEADHLERGPGKPSADPYKATFGEMITEKYRKIGLKL